MADSDLIEQLLVLVGLVSTAVPKSRRTMITQLPWSWLVARVVDVFLQFPSGVTEAIVRSEVQQQWLATGQLSERTGLRAGYSCIDNFLEERGQTSNHKLELRVVGLNRLSYSNTTVLILADEWSDKRMQMYLHERFAWLTTQAEDVVLAETTRLRVIGAKLVDNSGYSENVRSLPSPLAVWMLDSLAQRHFLERFFPVDNNSASARTKILSIGQVLRHNNHASVCVYLKEHSSSDGQTAELELWDEQVEMAELVNEGDLLFLYRPYIVSNSEKLKWQYGSATVLFCIQAPIEKETVALSQRQAFQEDKLQIPRDAKGCLDCRFVNSFICTRDLRPNMINLLLVVVVDSVAKLKESQAVKYFLRAHDSFGNVEITLKSALSFEPLRWLPGHVIVLEQVEVSTKMELNCLGRFTNLSTLSGTIETRNLFSKSSLSQLSTGHSIFCHCFVVDVIVEETSIKPLWAKAVTRSHMACHRSVERNTQGIFYCSFCDCSSISIDDTCYNYNLTLNLFDGMAFRRATCLSSAAVQVLDCEANDFIQLEEAEQDAILKAPSHKMFRFLLYQLNDIDVRIDAASILMDENIALPELSPISSES